MSSSINFVGLAALRTTNFKLIKTFATAALTKSLNLSINIVKLRAITTTTTRYYQQLTTISLNSTRREAGKTRQQQTAVNNTSVLKIIQKLDKDNHRFLSSFHKYKDIMDVPPGIFKGALDRFNGVTVKSLDEYNADDNFVEKLQKSLAYWQVQNRRAIWFYVQTEHSEWVPHLTKMNFEFHHAKTGVVVLNRWLPENEYANLPVYSHTMLGVGGLVVNDKNEVLVVSERFALIPNSWKLPGGYAETRENIVDAAIREVLEETGVETIFNTVICLRHAHGGPFGCSDIYCVVALTPTTTELKRCEREIAKVKWMPCEEYLQHPNVHETNRHFVRCYLDYKKRGIRFTCEKAQHQILKKEYCLYYMKAIEEGEDVKNGSNQDNKELGKL